MDKTMTNGIHCARAKNMRRLRILYMRRFVSGCLAGVVMIK